MTTTTTATTTMASRRRLALPLFTAAALAAAAVVLPAAPARAAESCQALTLAEVDASFDVSNEGDLAFSNVGVDFEAGNRVVISADVTVAGFGGKQRTSSIIAVLIGLLVPGQSGFMDYTDDSCMEKAVPGRSSGAAPRACSVMARAFRDFVGAKLGAPAADVLLSQEGDALWKWMGPELDAYKCVVPHDVLSGLPR
jgi:hypothetical protein